MQILKKTGNNYICYLSEDEVEKLKKEFDSDEIKILNNIEMGDFDEI